MPILRTAYYYAGDVNHAIWDATHPRWGMRFGWMMLFLNICMQANGLIGAYGPGHRFWNPAYPVCLHCSDYFVF